MVDEVEDPKLQGLTQRASEKGLTLKQIEGDSTHDWALITDEGMVALTTPDLLEVESFLETYPPPL